MHNDKYSNNVLIVLGHPVENTFSDQLLDAYRKGAEKNGSTVKVLTLRLMEFDLNFKVGYRGNQTLEPDLKNAQKDIIWADHIVFIYPNWWSTFPALMKGFIDRTFLPGFAFKYHPGHKKWDKLLSGRSARLIVTMDNTRWYYFVHLNKPGHNAMKKGILHFCGIKPVKVSTIGPLRSSSKRKRTRWLRKIEYLGSKSS